MLCELASAEARQIPQLLLDELISAGDISSVFEKKPAVLLGNSGNTVAALSQKSDKQPD